jgi:hypothetical protein
MAVLWASLLQAEILTQRVLIQNARDVGKAHCAAEWQNIQAFPVDEIAYDALQIQVDNSSDEPFEQVGEYPWPYPEIDLRNRAFVIVTAADVGLVVPLLEKARAFDDGEVTLETLREYAHGYQRRRAFQECLRLSHHALTSSMLGLMPLLNMPCISKDQLMSTIMRIGLWPLLLNAQRRMKNELISCLSAVLIV